MKEIKNIRYSDPAPCLLDIYYPDGIGECDVIVWAHGGGLTKGNKGFVPFVKQFTDAGFAFASVEYRMYPDAKFPDFIEDFATAVKFLQDKASFPRFRGFIVSGRSAGAYLTLMLYLDKKYLENAGADRNRIRAFVSDSAQATVHFNVLAERGLDSRLERIDEAAPMYFLMPDMDSSVPLLLIYYTEDMVCRPEQTKLFYRKFTQLCPDAKDTRVFIKELPGKHVHGSKEPNEDGTYDYANASLEFFGKAGLI